MDQLVDIVFEDARWEGFGLEAISRKAALGVFEALDMAREGFSIAVLACDDARIMELNTEFRDKPKATNVLSWPSEERGAEFVGEDPERPEAGTAEDPEELGDIAIAWETCMAEAAEQEKSPEDHVTHLMIHATLHLLGYDHIEDEDAELMEALEVRILAQMGISDPY